ncbi:hypothetical protein NC653_005859 [Populus alba x Populus x berolinensis]|uniref:Uncharacterized protein n=1 Tax=Populus alba x Populus x berolinensis TaxID=444605 RepID=A0AAD6RCW0_9ROSI|nr:hypothetical protein NC653_005859 [Populus alba x Populus x berolinensis]
MVASHFSQIDQVSLSKEILDCGMGLWEKAESRFAARSPDPWDSNDDFMNQSMWVRAWNPSEFCGMNLAKDCGSPLATPVAGVFGSEDR